MSHLQSTDVGLAAVGIWLFRSGKAGATHQMEHTAYRSSHDQCKHTNHAHKDSPPAEHAVPSNLTCVLRHNCTSTIPCSLVRSTSFYCCFGNNDLLLHMWFLGLSYRAPTSHGNAGIVSPNPPQEMHLDSEGQPLRWLPTNTAINILRKLESEQVCHLPALLLC